MRYADQFSHSFMSLHTLLSVRDIDATCPPLPPASCPWQSANELFSTHAAILESLCSTNLAFMYRTGTITYVQGTR